MERTHQRAYHPSKVTKRIVEDNLNFYTEKSTLFIYEATFLDEFVLVRPATPAFYDALRKCTWEEFTSEFEEFGGDHMKLRAYLDGEDEPEKQEVTLI